MTAHSQSIISHGQQLIILNPQLREILILIIIIIRYTMSEQTAQIPTTTAQQIVPTTPPKVEQQLSFAQNYNSFKQDLCNNWTAIKEQTKAYSDWDTQVATHITHFKRDYIFTIGDLLNRSICMAVAGGLTYKLLSFNATTVFSRTRNMGVSFMLNGWLFAPELFNPFLKHE